MVVLKHASDRDEFHKGTIEKASPQYRNRSDTMSSKLSWTPPETKEDKHRNFIVRRVRVGSRRPTQDSFEVRQRSARIFSNEQPLLTVCIDPTGEAKLRFKAVDTAFVEGLVQRSVAEWPTAAAFGSLLGPGVLMALRSQPADLLGMLSPFVLSWRRRELHQLDRPCFDLLQHCASAPQAGRLLPFDCRLRRSHDARGNRPSAMVPLHAWYEMLQGSVPSLPLKGCV